jgi:hypothetical protein
MCLFKREKKSQTNELGIRLSMREGSSGIMAQARGGREGRGGGGKGKSDK